MDRRDLARLGHYVVSRRVALGYRNRTDLANSLQFTARTLADIEHGVRRANPGTYAMLENKLAWAPGSIDTILTGGEPKETVVELRRPTSAPLAHTARDALSRAATEELLFELRRRIIAPRDRRHEAGTTATALTHKATGLNWTRSQHLTDPLPDPDAVCRAVRPRQSSGGQEARRSGNAPYWLGLHSRS